jgi:hypothetical protein
MGKTLNVAFFTPMDYWMNEGEIDQQFDAMELGWAVWI